MVLQSDSNDADHTAIALLSISIQNSFLLLLVRVVRVVTSVSRLCVSRQACSNMADDEEAVMLA